MSKAFIILAVLSVLSLSDVVLGRILWAERDAKPVLRLRQFGREYPRVIDISIRAGKIGNFGSCSVPQIQFGAGFDNRKETSYEPVNMKSYNHGSAQNIDIISKFICGADQTARTTCASALAESLLPRIKLALRLPVLALGVATFSVGGNDSNVLPRIFLVVAASTKWSLRAVNALSIFKIQSLLDSVVLRSVAVTGVGVLGGFTRISDPLANFHSTWHGSTTNPNALATALVKTNFAYVGWFNAFKLLGEVKVPLDEIKGSGRLVGALFFQHVFSGHWASKILPVLVTLTSSCVGNIVSKIPDLTIAVCLTPAQRVGQARVLREVARQGLLPYPTFFASIRPFGTPLGPVALKYALTVLVVSLLPVPDAFNFLLDLASYPHLVVGAGARRASEGLPRSPFQTLNIVIVLRRSVALSMCIPARDAVVPPEDGHADASFSCAIVCAVTALIVSWESRYCVIGVALPLFLCVLYYYVWLVLLPEIGRYGIGEEVVELGCGVLTSRLVRKYKARSLAPASCISWP
ncbi:hypothetical protein BJV78DRAFT_1151812 [Lactifluus subvellereus]|nr:hypothetical protein BJV78DRAFT_1151812 [Lactifluus subvellereus]